MSDEGLLQLMQIVHRPREAEKPTVIRRRIAPRPQPIAFDFRRLAEESCQLVRRNSLVDVRSSVEQFQAMMENSAKSSAEQFRAMMENSLSSRDRIIRDYERLWR